ncbi:hypothetical protein [Bradyrhizobium sp. 200]|uniref:hypothetical protein n=1 Tax=Bradyrhizobium sp. 200 TaxID=2782665 RepID=UPI001FFE37E6|nr:hypothetical protein [Bradyrhizobium sp. 200]
MKAAQEKRKQALVNMGHVKVLGEGQLRAPRDLIQRLDAIDIERAGKGSLPNADCNGSLSSPAATSLASLSAQPSYPAAGSR